MMLQLYTAALTLLLIILGPVLLPLALLWPKARKGLTQRLGRLPREAREFMYVGEGSLWVHAASLGELNAIAPVIKLLLEKLTGVPVIFSCTTLAGVDQARKLFPEGAAHFLLPVDLPYFLKPIFRRYKPRFAILAETELWPNFIHLLRVSGSQLMLMNGRMSERSLKRYSSARTLFAETLLKFDTLVIQSAEDAERFIALGAKPSRVLVSGNTKFDVEQAARAARKKGEQLREALGIKPGSLVVVAGSTRPGEEPLLFEAFKSLKRSPGAVTLILAPRHLERVSEVESAASAAGLEYMLRSRASGRSEVVILDTLGELAAAYSFASLAWIGGSWQPFGGQNPLEASAQGVPVLFGPDMKHFKEPARILLEAGAAMQVDAAELGEASRVLLKDAAKRQAMGQAGAEALKKNSGASQKSADIAWKLAVMARLRETEHDWRNQSAFASLKVSEFGSTVRAPR